MKLQEHKITGLYTIRPDLHKDVRGVFCRSFCENELAQYGKNFRVKQGNISENFMKYTLRGFHYQVEPVKESKILTCVIGALYNVVLDLRSDSETYKEWVALEISSELSISSFILHSAPNHKHQNDIPLVHKCLIPFIYETQNFKISIL